MVKSLTHPQRRVTIMCDLFSDVAWLSKFTNVSLEYAYNELMDCEGDTAMAILACRGAYFENLGY